MKDKTFEEMLKNATAYYIELERADDESGHYVGLIIFGRHGPETRFRFKDANDLTATGMIAEREIGAIEEAVEDMKRSGKNKFQGIVTLLQGAHYASNLIGQKLVAGDKRKVL